MRLFRNNTGTHEFEASEKGYHYEHLDENLKKEYDKVVQSICRFQRKVSTYDVNNIEEMNTLMKAIIFEQPQFFYLNTKKVNVIRQENQYLYEFDYIYDKKTAQQIMQEIEEKTEYIFSQIITNEMSDYEKILSIHDYLTDCIQYDFSALSLDYVYDAFTIEGALLKKRAVCEGIAKGIAYLLGKLGIPVMVVIGSSEIDGQEMDHAWNIVELGGQYYHIDATWDLQEINHFSSMSHLYFNLDDESMLENHNWKLEEYPSCSSIKYNYYVQKKTYFRTIRSFELFIREVLKESRTYIDVRFEDTLDIPDEDGKYIVSLIEKNARYLGKEFEISYVFHPDNYVFQANMAF